MAEENGFDLSNQSDHTEEQTELKSEESQPDFAEADTAADAQTVTESLISEEAEQTPAIEPDKSEPLIEAENKAVSDKPQDPRDTTIKTLGIILGVVSAVALCLAVTVLVLAIGSGGQSTSTTTPPPTTATSAPAETPTGTTTEAPAPLFLSNYISANPNVLPDAIIMDLHTDYQCPWCAREEQIYGQALSSLAQAGEIDLRIHIRSMIGQTSGLAAMSAACANQVGYFLSYHTVVFANQPADHGDFTAAMLREEFPAKAGITGQALKDFQTCYDTQATASQVEAIEQEARAAGVESTPTFYLEGMKVSFDLQADAETIQPADAANLLAELKRVTGRS